jgi:hypothetical protein
MLSPAQKEVMLEADINVQNSFYREGMQVQEYKLA